MFVFIAVGAVLAATPAPGTTTEKPKLAVTELQAAGGLDPSVASALTESITAEISARGLFDVLSSRDIQALMGHERQRQLMGCADESNCLAELAGAMGARFVMNGVLAKIGAAYQLTLQTLDANRAQPIGRSVRIANTLEELSGQIPFAVAEATATPLPPPPSRVLPYSLMAAGGLLLLGGGAAALDSFSRDMVLGQELERGASTPGRLRSQAEYEEDQRFIGTERTLGLAVALAGIGLATTGFLLNPKDAVGGAREVKVAFVPSPNGFALVGVWR